LSIIGNLSDAEVLELVESLNSKASPEAAVVPDAIIERTIFLGEVGSDGLAFVNLEKAELQPPPFYLEVAPGEPDIFKHNPRIDEWIAASGVDLALHLKRTNWAFAALGTRMIFMKEQAGLLEQMTKKNADALLTTEQARKESGSYHSFGALVGGYACSIDYVFKTRGGAVGFLQMSGFTNNSNGVKLRYKVFTNEMALKPVPPAAAGLADAGTRLKTAREELALLREKFTDQNPLVQQKQSEIKELEKATAAH
jgi:hypothetical protein